jgi:hypothetical protein
MSVIITQKNFYYMNSLIAGDFFSLGTGYGKPPDLNHSVDAMQRANWVDNSRYGGYLPL